MKSLRVRLLVGTLFWITLSLVAAGWGIGQLFHAHVEEQFYNELRLHLDQLTAEVELNAANTPILPDPPGDPRFGKALSGLYWQIDLLDDKGLPTGTPLRSRSLWDQQLDLPIMNYQNAQRLQLQMDEGTHLFALARRITLDGIPLRLAVAADENFLRQPVSRFQHEFWWALGILGAGLIVAALVQVWSGLAPLKRLRSALQQVRKGQTQQLEGPFPEEIMPLVTEFNSVLTQNAEVIARARTQAGNLAHALKTPLAILANAAHAQPANPLAQLVAQQIAEARQQVDYHLLRAQAAASAGVPGVQTALAPVLNALARTMHHIHATRQIEFVLPPFNEELSFLGEERDLQEMLGNLLDNAFKWANSKVQVRVELHQGQLCIAIEDDGPGVADDKKSAVIQRGVRADERTPGSGLGLSIVADLAHLYGGELRLENSPLGGLKAQLCLPQALDPQ